MSIVQHRKLYKLTSTGKNQVWWKETEGNKMRTVSGQEGGKLVTSTWKVAKPMNVGKSNATTGEEQALLIVGREYEARLEREYQEEDDFRLNPRQPGEAFSVMLAAKYKDHPNLPSVWLAQPKLDGFRCYANSEGIWSRSNKPFPTCPHIHEALQELFEVYPTLVLDGELYNHEYKHDFNQIQECVGSKKASQDQIDRAASMVQYHVYDLVDLDPALRNWPFHMRTSTLRFLFDEVLKDKMLSDGKTPMFVYVETKAFTNLQDYTDQAGAWIEEGYEGSMIRIRDSVYEFGRARTLLKDKQFEDDEFVVEDVLEGEGNRSGMAGKILFTSKQGKKCRANIRGNFAFYRELLAQKDSYIGTEVTVRYQNITPDGSLRFPVAIKFWKGKRDA